MWFETIASYPVETAAGLCVLWGWCRGLGAPGTAITGIQPHQTGATGFLIHRKYKANCSAYLSSSCLPPKDFLFLEIEVRRDFLSEYFVVLKTNDEILVLKFFNILIWQGYGAGSPAVQHFKNILVCKLYASLAVREHRRNGTCCFRK